MDRPSQAQETASLLLEHHLEPDSWNISDGMSSPTEPSNEHLILQDPSQRHYQDPIPVVLGIKRSSFLSSCATVVRIALEHRSEHKITCGQSTTGVLDQLTSSQKTSN